MPNPWLAVPLSDYEQHMNLAGVQQLEVLSDLFAESLRRCSPSSVAILGIAGGNGLDHIDGKITERVVGLDLNPQYLEVVRARYSHLIGLELYCVDLSEQHVDLEPVQLAHAALIFEHAGVDLCLENALSLVTPAGSLSVVLQLSSKNEQVSPSRFTSIQNLKPHFSLIDSDYIHGSLERRGFHLSYETTRALPGDKGFWMGLFRAPRDTSLE